ncbi:MAG: hypothetical protein A3G76_04090 [Acidobacteria bacterium RIFCSPLOWO2_12_FULL_65_11]|nr:MAG: hypothetical protein A3H95_15895 [Acidobacteria bacterium RIFCSPLOWO2_02_FULL_64_15]OFW32755.1 MAG: hypothetical protein A3G76_04090 [Acidobacteria bacterium RIFCSPLOWO2_12_FULL_65_11]
MFQEQSSRVRSDFRNQLDNRERPSVANLLEVAAEPGLQFASANDRGSSMGWRRSRLPVMRETAHFTLAPD